MDSLKFETGAILLWAPSTITTSHCVPGCEPIDHVQMNVQTALFFQSQLRAHDHIDSRNVNRLAFCFFLHIDWKFQLTDCVFSISAFSYNLDLQLLEVLNFGATFLLPHQPTTVTQPRWTVLLLKSRFYLNHSTPTVKFRKLHEVTPWVCFHVHVSTLSGSDYTQC